MFAECRNISAETLSAYLDNQLGSDQLLDVARHLQDCHSCSDNLMNMKEIDRNIVREWEVAMPFSHYLYRGELVDKIMHALPPVPEKTIQFPMFRVHAKIRWMRIAAGAVWLGALIGAVWAGCCLGQRNNAATASPVKSSALPGRKH